MNKKLNTVFFVAGATLFNIIVILALILLSFLLVSVVLGDRLGPNGLSLILMFLFLASIAGTFLIYRWILNWLSRRVDLNKYFLPLFKRKR